MRKTLPEIINDFYKIPLNESGPAYLKSFVKKMNTALGVRNVFIGIPTEGELGKIKTLFVSQYGEIIENIEYDLAGSPCYNVVSGLRVCLYPKNVANVFPEDTLLKDLGIESYIGAPIVSEKGELKGILVAIDTKEITNPNLFMSAMEYCSARASVEFDREAYEKVMWSINENLETLIDQRTLERDRARARMYEQEKLASLGRVIAGIAHEINNPLNFIINGSLLMDESVDELKEFFDENLKSEGQNGQKDEVDRILTELSATASIVDRHGKRIHGIVKNMLNQLNGGKTERVTLNLKFLIEEHLKFSYLASQLKHENIKVDIEKEYKVNHEEVSLSADFPSVLLNIYNNAFESLYMKYSATREEAKLLIQCREINHMLEISIKDNGLGIKKENLTKVLEPFYTTRSDIGGTGLGLSLAREIVEKNHGSIEITSEFNEFTQVRIVVPILGEGS